MLLLAIAAFSITGTVIEQGETLAFYQVNYPEDPALFGFLSWKVILIAGAGPRLPHLVVSGPADSIWGPALPPAPLPGKFPALGAARKWKFYTKPRQFQKLALSADPAAYFCRLANSSPATEDNYKVFQEGNALYSRKGIVGRIGPIVVHASMILILLGAIWGAMTGFFAQEMVPSGETFQIRNIFDAGPWAEAQIPKDWGVRVNRFWIDYTPEREPSTNFIPICP